MGTYLFFEECLLLGELQVAEECLVIDGGEFSDDLYEEAVLMIVGVVVVGDQPEDFPVDIKDVLEVGDLVLKMVVLLSQQLLQTHVTVL